MTQWDNAGIQWDTRGYNGIQDDIRRYMGIQGGTGSTLKLDLDTDFQETRLIMKCRIKKNNKL